MTRERNQVLWLDLETTGLDDKIDSILELAWAIDDGPIQSVVFPFIREPWMQINPRVIEMHTKNALWDDCERAAFLYRGMDFAAFADGTVEPILDALQTDKQFTLGGDSVHFDLGFLKRYIPKLARACSHRLLDMSAVKLFLDHGLSIDLAKGEPAHRAAADVEASRKRFHAAASSLWAAMDHRCGAPSEIKS